MNQPNHRAITEQALRAQLAPAALETIIAANLGQDAWRYQIGHDHFHFDNNAFIAGNRYINEQRALIASALTRAETHSAWEAFGRLSHAAQDFYAHSNYISLWLAGGGVDDPHAVDPLSAALLRHPDLHSCKLYYPLEVLAFIPAFAPYVVPHLPQDSHAHMNKDRPGRPHFDLAFAAAVRRTQHEFNQIVASLAPQALTLFIGHA